MQGWRLDKRIGWGWDSPDRETWEVEVHPCRNPRRALAARLTPAVLGAALLLTAGAATRSPVPILPRESLGGVAFQVTTKSPRAQEYFDQALMQAFGFDHVEAIRSYEAALGEDPNCAMAYWGIAYAAGPNINIPFMDESQNKMAWEAVQKAVALGDRVTPMERALITALEARYAWPAPEDRRTLDVAFAAAMRKVHQEFPDDPNVTALTAEALMDLRPWDLWSAAGEARPETPEIVEMLQKLLAEHPKHVLAAHLYIHAVEASPHPELAQDAASALRGLVQGSGHLIHMPSHIDIRLGRYKEAIAANAHGVAIDRQRVKRSGPDFPYAVYRAHNFHFIAYSAMFDGQRGVAMQAARDILKEVPLDIILQMPDFLDAFWAMPYHVQVRFGLWDEILKEPPPPRELVVTTAFWRYARGIAYAATGRVEAAAAERDSFEAVYARVPESRAVGNNLAVTVLAIGRHMLDGELEYRRGNHDKAFEALRLGVAADDSLRYDEPWGWAQPVRHALGALLLEQGRVEEAEGVYRHDLELHPGNGWALHGLSECLSKSGRADEAKAVDARFRSAWTRADTKIKASCFCRRGA